MPHIPIVGRNHDRGTYRITDDDGGVRIAAATA